MPTEEKLAAGMAQLELVFSDRESDPQARADNIRRRLVIYGDLLADLTDEEWVVAVRRALVECKWFPKPAELVEFAGRYALTMRYAVSSGDSVPALPPATSARGDAELVVQAIEAEQAQRKKLRP